MIVGLVTPVVTLLPDAHARWEETAAFDDVVAIAQAADRLGYHHLTCSDHVGIPSEVAAVRGGRYWEPLAVFGALAAHTQRIRFATHVLVLGYHHPLAIAKRYGTLDQVSGGRVVIGVGSGSLEEEFALLGAPFANRGERADDAMRALRAAWGRSRPEYHGTYYDFHDFLIDPCAVREHVDLWVGGRTRRSLRRAVELGDGWVPFGLRLPDLRAAIEAARATPAWTARERPLEILLEPRPPVDPAGDPDATAQRVRAVLSVGATGINLRFVHHSRAHYIEQLEAMRAVLDGLDGDARTLSG
jgi:probable F420-dependent oxidoreductase